MKISDISERTRLQRRIEEHPDDVGARRALARLFLEAGDVRRAASEIISIARVHMARDEGREAFRAGRFGLGLDPSSIEMRMLMVQVHARFPDLGEGRAAAPVDAIVELTPTQRLEEIELLDSLDVEPVETAPREEITRPPLPAAARKPSEPMENTSPGTPVQDISDSDIIAATPSEYRDEPTQPRSAIHDDEDAVSVSGAHRGFERRRSALQRARGEVAPRRVVVGRAGDHLRLGDVPQNALFERLPKALREDVFAACELVEYPDGAEVVEAGVPLERLVLVCDGKVEARPDIEATAGALVGEFEFLTGSLPIAAARVAGSLSTLELTAEAANELRAVDPQTNDAFVAVLRDRILADLMRRATIFASLSREQKLDLSSRFFTLAVGPGETILSPGEINRRLLVLQSGELVVDGRGAGGAGRLTLGPGEFFGFASTVLGRPVQVGVVASAASTLLVLPEQEVYRLVAGHKGVSRAARRDVVERGDAPMSIERVAGLRGDD